MASMTIRNLDEQLKRRLRTRAARHGRSMEEEARDILRSALATSLQPSDNMAAAIRRRIRETGGVVLEIPTREPVRDPVDFDG
jgi:antitoxin FitA